jgi:acetylornithine/succinyldiaminopimelate/putrescine aminotransferase
MLNRVPQGEIPLLQVYRRPDPRFVEGCGSWLIDDAGRRYLDFTSGIAVTALGHGSPVVRDAVERALDSGIIHTSNLYRTPPGEELALRLTALTGMDRVFFCNSGGEGVEGALKFARKWARVRGGWKQGDVVDPPGFRKTGIVALRGSFHGRLFGSVSITDKVPYRAPFEPVMPGVTFVDPLDLPALDHALDAEGVAALVLEPVQGEGGVRPFSPVFLQTVRRWTEERGIALILDEVQCGVGRTGDFSAHEVAGIRPDLLVLAKPLAGGLPMGAILLTEAVASALEPGDHGTTFGGGPFLATVALAVVNTISAPDFLAQVREKGARLEAGLRALEARHPGRVREVRGRGLMRGVELDGPVQGVVARAFDLGLLLVGAGPNTLRILPPLNVEDSELDEGLNRLERAMMEDA